MVTFLIYNFKIIRCLLEQHFGKYFCKINSSDWSRCLSALQTKTLCFWCRP